MEQDKDVMTSLALATADRVTRQINAALKQQISVAEALKNAQHDVEQITGSSGAP